MLHGGSHWRFLLPGCRIIPDRGRTRSISHGRLPHSRRIRPGPHFHGPRPRRCTRTTHDRTPTALGAPGGSGAQATQGIMQLLIEPVSSGKDHVPDLSHPHSRRAACRPLQPARSGNRAALACVTEATGLLSSSQQRGLTFRPETSNWGMQFTVVRWLQRGCPSGSSSAPLRRPGPWPGRR